MPNAQPFIYKNVRRAVFALAFGAKSGIMEEKEWIIMQNTTERPPCLRRHGDRTDGWRVKSADALFSVIPHIMKMRCDSQVFFDQTVEIGELEKFI